MSQLQASPVETAENEALELRLLLDAMLLKYGYDFRDYARASLKRRVYKRMAESGAANLSEVTHRVIHDPEFFDRLLADLSINVTEMFREPRFFRELRDVVLRVLAPKPFLKVWHAGCATGEEVYSMAILLHEAGVLGKSRIIATDINEAVVTKAREGIYPLDRVREYTLNYQRAGGTGSFAEYYVADYSSATIVAELKRRVVFAVHNLVTDAGVGEMDMVVCRNVLIYFNRELQERVVSMFADCLVDGGLLCLGARESVRFTAAARLFETVNNEHRIYRRVRRSHG